MKRQLKTVVNKLTKTTNPIIAKHLKYYLLQLLYSRSNERLWLVEGEVMEITYNNITVSFTWDMISAVNGKTNNYIDLISIKDEDEVIEFFESEELVMPVCKLFSLGGHCPYCIEDDDYNTKEARETNKLCCETHREPTKKELGEY